jgi:Tol biopolymer transport system component
MAKRRGRRLVLGVGAVLCAGALSGCAQQYRSQLVSINAAGTNSGSGVSDHQSFSPDGTKIVFDSTSVDLDPKDTNASSDVYLRDLSTGTTRLLSLNAAGTGPGNRASSRPVFSPDGTKVLFVSSAANLGPPSDSDNVNDLFVRDLTTGTTSLVSVNSAGTDGGSLASDMPVFSPDSTKVAFRSRAFDLVPNDANATYDIFVRDLVAGTTELVTVNQAGTGSGSVDPEKPAAGSLFAPDSQRVVFVSSADDLVPDDANGDSDVFLRNLAAGTTRQVSTTSTGAGGNGAGSFAPAISSDGTRIAFESFSTNLDTTVTDTNDEIDVYVKDLTTDATRLVSVNAAGTAAGAGGESRAPVFRPGTAQVAFTSAATGLTASSANGIAQVYLRDLTTGTTTLVTKSSAGDRGANGPTAGPLFNADGTKLAFNTSAGDLGPKDTNATTDVYVKDLPGGIISLVSFDTAGDNAGNGASFQPQFQPLGAKIAFLSWASNVAAPDHDTDQDVFLASVVASG